MSLSPFQGYAVPHNKVDHRPYQSWPPNVGGLINT